jgi:secreted trypsin-like serine protease
MRHSKICVALLFAVSGCVIGDAAEGGNQEGIIGGTVDTGDPSVVAILARQPGAQSGSLCTGTVIAPTKVLTAAHCVDPKVVGAGNVFTVHVGTNLSGQQLAVAGVAWDPAFDVNNLTGGHDIAVVTLAQPAALKPLPIGSVQAGAIRLVGYGMATHVSHPLVPSGAGTKRTVTTTVNGADARLIHIGDSNHQTCHGDSGGPAFQIVNGVETVVGVTSYGSDLQGGAVCFYGGYDTRVDAYTGFIAANL